MSPASTCNPSRSAMARRRTLARAGLLGFGVDLFLHGLVVVATLGLDIDARHHELGLNPGDDVLGVPINQRGRNGKSLRFTTSLTSADAISRRMRCWSASDQLGAYLGSQLVERAGFAGILGQLVVERRHLAAAHFFDGHAQLISLPARLLMAMSSPSR